MSGSTIIFHVGPGKCGSSTIQETLAALGSARNDFRLHHLRASQVLRLGSAIWGGAEALRCRRLMKIGEQERQTLIFSNELLFQSDQALVRLAQIAVQNQGDIRLVGYCRRPSGFLQSSFCQWYFRSPDHLKSASQTVGGLVDDPGLFSALERHFIAAIQSGFVTARHSDGVDIVDWFTRYHTLEEALSPYGVQFSVGTIDRPANGPPMIVDFLERCGLAAGSAAVPSSKRSNQQFSLDLVEAVADAIQSGVAMPGPHENNAKFMELSCSMPAVLQENDDFLDMLKACADTLLWENNRKLCKQYGINPAAFSPSQPVTKDEALSLVIKEAGRRAINHNMTLERRNSRNAEILTLMKQQGLINNRTGWNLLFHRSGPVPKGR